MRIMTVLAVASLAISGVACSESKTKAAPEGTDTVSVEASSGGTLNLSLPSSLDSSAETGSGTLNLNIGGASSEGQRLIGSDQLNGVDFGEVPGPALAIEDDNAPGADEEDDIIRLQPN